MPPTPPIRWNSLQVWLLPALLAGACNPNDDQIFTVDNPALTAGGGTIAAGAAGKAGDFARAGSSSGQVAGATGGGAGSSSTHLDPNVTFDWTETAPGRGSCVAQTFIGNFTCDISPVVLSPTVEGSLLLTFGGTLESQPLNVNPGQLSAFDDSGNGMPFLTAPVTGRLDCSTRIVTLDVTQTMTEVLPIARQLVWILPMAQPMVNGTLHGNFNASMQTINGDVALAFADTQTKCLGTFAVQAVQ
jgi:hypothetical protein